MFDSLNIRAAGRHILLSGLAPAAIGITIVVLAENYVRLAPWDIVFVTIGSVLIGVGVFDVVFRLVAFKQFVDELSSTVLRALKLPVRAFYESRSHLDSVEHELSDVEEIWAVWYVGPYRDFEAFFPKGRSGRIVLTSPYSSALSELGKIRKGDVDTMASVIRNITKHAMEKNIEVRWFDGPVCNNVVIANPQKDGAWIRVELMIPHDSPQSRPSFRVEKGGNRGLYDTFASAFEKMWGASQLPDLGPRNAEPEKVGPV